MITAQRTQQICPRTTPLCPLWTTTLPLPRTAPGCIMQVTPASERDLSAWNHTGNQSRDWPSTSPSQNGSLLAAANRTDSLDRDEDLAKTEILVLGVIFLVAVIGNLTVLLALCKTKKKMSRMHLFIRHLSMADLVVAVFQVLPQFSWDITYRFKGPDSLCRIVKHLQLFSMYASTYMTVMMSVDRYIAICHPLKTLQKPTKRSHRMIVATWLGSLLLSVPQYFIFSVREVEKGSGVYDCWASFVAHWGLRTYITWITIAVFIIPVLIMVACYSCICCSIFRNIKYKTQKAETGTSFENGQVSIGANNMKTISKAKVRTVKMTLVIVVVYILCWAPFFAAQMWSVWDNNSPKDDSTNAVFTLTMLLSSLNSCCNPWIYMFFSGHLLSDIIHSFPCCRKVTQKLEDSEGSIKQDTVLTKVNHRSSTGSSYNWKDSVTSP